MTGDGGGWRKGAVMADRVPVDQAVAVYLRYFAELTPDNVGRIDRLVVPDLHFRGPLGEFRSREKLRRLLERMFERLKSPRFIMRDHALSGQIAYIRWTFTFRLGGSPKPWLVEGVSEVRFDHAGHAMSHFDHWDAAEQLYEKLPALGWVMRQIKRRIAD